MDEMFALQPFWVCVSQLCNISSVGWNQEPWKEGLQASSLAYGGFRLGCEPYMDWLSGVLPLIAKLGHMVPLFTSDFWNNMFGKTLVWKTLVYLLKESKQLFTWLESVLATSQMLL